MSVFRMHIHADEDNAECGRGATRQSEKTQRAPREDRCPSCGAEGTHRPRKRPTPRFARWLAGGIARHSATAAASPARPERNLMLVDTSIWVDHFRRRDPRLSALLERAEVECHPFVIGELACGNLRGRAQILNLLRDLPAIPAVEHDEALAFIDAQDLMGSGLGWIDVHLLASARLTNTMLWTRDRRLAAAARRLGLAPV